MNARIAVLLSTLVLSSPTLVACSSTAAPHDHVGAVAEATLTINGLSTSGLIDSGLIDNGLVDSGLLSSGLTSGALTSLSGLGNVLDTNPHASMFLSYVVSCALPAGQTVVVPSAANPGTSYTFNGSIGIAPTWGASDTGSCDATCQKWVSACVISRVNYLGAHVDLSIRGANPALALVAGEVTDYPNREATYFGNVLVSPQQIYGCQTAGDDMALIGRPCGNGADTTGCVIDVIGDCGSVCSVNDPTTGYYGTCTAAGTTYGPAVTIYRLPN
jgi:hypothetical protein